MIAATLKHLNSVSLKVFELIWAKGIANTPSFGFRFKS